MALYEKLALTTKRLFDRYGRQVHLRQRNSGTGDYDPSTGGAAVAGTDGSTDVPRKGLVMDQPGSQISQRFGNNQQNNTLVQKTEKWIYLDAIGVKPALEDKLVIDDVAYSIIDIQETGPGGVPVLYLLVIRK